MVDASCAIDVKAVGPQYESDIASSKEIHRAAFRIFAQCVIGTAPGGTPLQSGGIARGVGR